MSLLSLIAAQQAKDKIDQGYTDLPPDDTGDFSGLMDSFNFAETAISNVPNVANDAISGVIDLLTKPEVRKQTAKTVADFALGSMEKINDGPLFDTELGKEQAPKRIEMIDKAFAGVKEVLTDERKTREMLSQNPDVLAGGLWGAGKAGKFAGKHLGPKLAEKTEKMLTDQGLIKHIMPPDSKTFGKGEYYSLEEFNQLGSKIKDPLALSAHKYRGDVGYMAVEGFGKGINEKDFIKLMANDQETLQKYDYENHYEAASSLQELVGLEEIDRMLEGSAITLEKPLYIVRAQGFANRNTSLRDPHDPSDVNPNSLYSATVIDPSMPEFKDLDSPYGDNPYLIKLEPGTTIYHPAGRADYNEVVVRGDVIDSSQGMKKGILSELGVSQHPAPYLGDDERY